MGFGRQTHKREPEVRAVGGCGGGRLVSGVRGCGREREMAPDGWGAGAP